MMLFENLLIDKLSQYEFIRLNLQDPISIKITTVAIYGFILIVLYKLIFQIGITIGIWELPGKEFFIDTPVHCAHVYVESFIRNHLEIGKLNYHIEFSPEEYDDENPDLGTTLAFLRKKLYFLFKDSNYYNDLKVEQFTIDNVKIFKKTRELIDDSKPLCLIGVETGDKLHVEFVI